MALERATYAGPSGQRVRNARPRRVGGRVGGVEAWGASPRGAALGADLGGSSKYTNENFVDRSGEGFHVNSSWTWVSRP